MMWGFFESHKRINIVSMIDEWLHLYLNVAVSRTMRELENGDGLRVPACPASLMLNSYGCLTKPETTGMNEGPGVSNWRAVVGALEREMDGGMSKVPYGIRLSFRAASTRGQGVSRGEERRERSAVPYSGARECLQAGLLRERCRVTLELLHTATAGAPDVGACLGIRPITRPPG